LSLGTSPLAVEMRYTILWTLLIVLGLSLSILDSRRPLGPLRSLNLAWGLSVGFIVGLPLLILTARGLAQVSAVLFPYTTAAALFQALVFVAPLGETLFFRGVLQEERGLAIGVVCAGLYSVTLFWPATAGDIPILIVAAIFSTALAVMYSYVRIRHGLLAAYACQVIANVMLMFVPSLLAPAG
jgi:membrane protease YdiL (CAAX protease family)